MEPGQANGGKELRISGPVVRSSAQALSVENLVGDAMLTCAVPDRLAEKAAALKPGDKIRMVCVRYRGRKAELRKIQRLGEKTNTRAEEKKAEERKAEERKAEEKRAEEKQYAAGQVAELGAAVNRRPGDGQAPRVPGAGREAGEARGPQGRRQGEDPCLGGQLVGIERP